MSKKNALGKGLGAIFTDLANKTDSNSTYVICGIEELSPNRFQPRKSFDGTELKNLVTSIKKNGILQPIIVRKIDSGYEIIAGERRWRAAQAAGLSEIPILIRDADDVDLAELSLIENIQREELNPIEEAEAYFTLLTRFNLSQEDISSRVGKDRSTIANSLRLRKLYSQAKNALIKKDISAGHARALLSLSSETQQNTVLAAILNRQLSVRETEQFVKRLNKQSLKKEQVAKSSELVDLENRLSRHFMTRINIKPKKKGGTIEIKYSSPDDLNRLSYFLMRLSDL